MKTPLRVILTIPLYVMLFLCFGITAFAAQTSESAMVTLPAGLITIEEEAFYGCTDITDVEIPEGVTAIGSSAFANSGLKALVIPASVENISENAFENTPLELVITPTGSYSANWAQEKGLSMINYSVADGSCMITKYTGVLQDVVIPSCIQGYPVTSIGNLAFLECETLQSVVIPDSVTSLGAGVFIRCTNLRSVVLPNSLSKLNAQYLFLGCVNLTNVVIPDSVTEIGAAMFYGTALTEINIPNSVTKIGDMAFANCKNLVSVSVPASVTQMGGLVFEECTALTSASISNETVGFFEFMGCSNLRSVYLSDSVKTIGWGAFSGCTELRSINIPSSVTKICQVAFHDCTSLSFIEISNPVTEIDAYAFDGCSGLSEISLSCSTIGDCAFSGCVNLSSVTLSDTVATIGSYAFGGCSSLKHINLPHSVRSIGDGAFKECSSLESVAIPNSVPVIGNEVFMYCSSLSSVSIPNSVSSVGIDAFYDCDSLNEITIPNSVTLIDERAFADCSNLHAVAIPGSVTAIGSSAFSRCSSLYSLSISNSVTCINRSAFSHCDALSTITIPDSVTEIDDWAFSYCNGLTSVIIPDSVKSIGDYAFYGCAGLENLTLSSSVETIGESAFVNTPLKSVSAPAGSYAESWANELSLLEPETPASDFSYDIVDNAYVVITAYNGSNKKVRIPASIDGLPVTEMLWETFSNSSNNYLSDVISVSIPASITQIEFNTFLFCENLKEILVDNENSIYYDINGVLFDKATHTLIRYPGGRAGAYTVPAGTTKIGDNAFARCYELTSIVITDFVTSIGDCSFYLCTNLASVDIPDSVTFIDRIAFDGCDSLTSVVIPDSVTSLGGFVFEGCSNLTSVILSDSLTSTGEGTFAGCIRLTSIEIPNSITTIGEDSFWGTGLTSITIPDSVTSIGDSAFSSCSNLKTVTIPDSVTSIGDGAFHDCENLTSVFIPYSVSFIGESAFAGSGLTTVRIPSSVTSISPYTFEYCTSLSSVTIPSSVTSIDRYAFSECSSLASVTIPESVMLIDFKAFADCDNLESISILSPAVEIGSQAFLNCKKLSTVEIPASVDSIADDAFSGCSNLSYNYNPTPSPAVPKIWSTESGPVYLGIGQVYTPLVTFQNMIIGEDYRYTLSSSNPSVVSVNGKNIKLLKSGSATITVTVGSESKSFPVRTGLELEVHGGSDFSISDNGYSLTLSFDEDAYFGVKTTTSISLGEELVMPGEASWRVENSALTCDQNGLIHASDCGTATVYLSVPYADKVMTTTCIVSIPAQSVTDFELDTETCNLGLNETAHLFTTFPKGQRSTIHFQSSAPQVAEVTNGRVKGISPGTAVITATADSGVRRQITFYVYGDGFTGYPDGELSRALEKTEKPMKKAVCTLDKNGSDLKNEKEDFLRNRIKISLGMQQYNLNNVKLPDSAVNAFYKVFTSEFDSVSASPVSYKNCKTDIELTNRIISDIVNGQDKGSFTFNAFVGGETRVYTCTYEKHGAPLGWGAAYYDGSIIDENNESFVWGATATDGVAIQAQMDYLKEYAELKVDEARNAFIKDGIKLTNINEVIDWIKSSLREDILDEIGIKCPGVRHLMEELERNLLAIKDLSKTDKAIRDSFDPKGKNPEKVISNVRDFHKNIESVVTDLETLIS